MCCNNHLKGFFFLFSIFFLMGCLQDSTIDRIPVRYTVLVRDGNTGEAISDASVELTDEKLMTTPLHTNEGGRVVFPVTESYINQFIITMNGYEPADTVDIISEIDTSLNLILRTLNIALLPVGLSSPGKKVYSYTVNVISSLDAEPIEGAIVSVRSGSGYELTAKTGSNGRAFLDSLPSNQNLFTIAASGYVLADTVHTVLDTSEAVEVLCALKVVLKHSVSE